MKYGLIGEKLGHSFSREIHEAIGSRPYELKELTREALPGFLQAADFAGINVTIPYKETVIPYLAEVDEAARLIGAVNTIVNRSGRLCGYNTDFYGMQQLFARLGIVPEGRKVLILGTGGTSKTAQALMRHLGAREVLRVSRTAREDAISYEQMYASHADADILINTTPCGMYPHGDACPVELERFLGLSGVVDSIYNPLRTRLVQAAQARGIPAEGGLYMLVGQAVRAAELFLNTTLPDGTLDATYGKILREKEDIVLIGMPSCGKSTVGKILRKTLGLPLIDSDVEIVREAGMPVKDFFAKFGEPAFRDLESRIIARISETGGQVIATGGGVPLRAENVQALKSNGRLFFIDRPLSWLMPTESRPLSSSPEKLKTLYETRHPIYVAAADVIIRADGESRDVAEEIVGSFQS